MRSTYLNLNATIGKEKRTPFEDLEFRYLDFEQQYGLKDLTAKSIWDLSQRLKEDDDLHNDYLTRKLGFDPRIPSEV